jgi:hypothetical protein
MVGEGDGLQATHNSIVRHESIVRHHANHKLQCWSLLQSLAERQAKRRLPK